MIISIELLWIFFFVIKLVYEVVVIRLSGAILSHLLISYRVFQNSYKNNFDREHRRLIKNYKFFNDLYGIEEPCVIWTIRLMWTTTRLYSKVCELLWHHPRWYMAGQYIKKIFKLDFILKKCAVVIKFRLFFMCSKIF